MNLDAIKARLAFATPGPWFARPNDLIGGWCVRTVDTPPSEGPGEVADFIREEDARLIAAAPADLAVLLAEVDRLRTVEIYAEHLRASMDAVRAALGHGADESVWPPGLTVAEAVERLRGEREAAEARIVAWLLDVAQDCRLCGQQRESAALLNAAGDIERGEHRRP